MRMCTVCIGLYFELRLVNRNTFKLQVDKFKCHSPHDLPVKSCQRRASKGGKNVVGQPTTFFPPLDLVVHLLIIMKIDWYQFQSVGNLKRGSLELTNVVGNITSRRRSPGRYWPQSWQQCVSWRR